MGRREAAAPVAYLYRTIREWQRLDYYGPNFTISGAITLCE